MALIVEDGTIVASANSYVTLAEAVAYATDHGLAFSPSPDVGNVAALIRATSAIDGKYGFSFPGYRKGGRTQSLHWPRDAAYDAGGWLIPNTEIPVELKAAVIEAAVRELANPGSMMPDLARGGAIQSMSAGSVSISYAANAEARTTYTKIDGIISNILGGMGGSGGGMFGTVVRG